MLFILGRTGSGKDHLGKILEKELGYQPVVSWTNRPIRANESNGVEHNFIDGKVTLMGNDIFVQNDGDLTKFADVVAYTEINGYSYWATQAQLESSAYYIIDPIGLYKYDEENDDPNYDVVYIESPSMPTVAKRSADRYKKTLTGLKTLHERVAAEDKEFRQFEQILDSWMKIKDDHSVLRLFPSENSKHEEIVEFIKDHEQGKKRNIYGW